MGTGRNGKSKKNNTAYRMAVVVTSLSEQGYLKKNLRPCHSVCGGYTVAILNYIHNTIQQGSANFSDC